ncbi:unnamed protein product [Staurois parvus]|uniref:Uncharacterized protein n=1 Tax=Staurois parvus TaxID=386267 RepID=A0ABN9BIT1_9NEOB|nr:unnamed protein product [Staurois parvus]
MGPLCPCPNSKKKPMKKVPGASHGAPTDPGPLGSARVSKWSVRPCIQYPSAGLHFSVRVVRLHGFSCGSAMAPPAQM